MCLAPYNITEAAQQTQNKISEAMEYLFDTKEEMPEGKYLYMCDELKGLYERCDKFTDPETFYVPFCDWSQECQLDAKNWLVACGNVVKTGFLAKK